MDKTNENNSSLAEWAEELEKFLGTHDGIDPNIRHKKKAILQSLSTQMIKNEKKNDDDREALSLPKAEIKSRKTSHILCLLFIMLVFTVCLGFTKYGYCQGKSFKLCWNNNIQDWIYPTLRAVRLLALPVIRYFPSISDVHESTCLADNPLYWDREVDCSLCRGVGVVTLSGARRFEELFYHGGVPVVVQDAVPTPVSLPALRRLYRRHRAEVRAGSARRMEGAPPGIDGLDRLLAAPARRLAGMRHCVQWRLLRVSAVRHLRQLFVRPYFISGKTEVSLHRYIYICGDQGDRFQLPVTEFANVWVSQHSGTRQVQLVPSGECSAACRPVSALLRPGETLFYNWRYWRPYSLPVNSTSLRETDASRGKDLGSETATPAESPESGVPAAAGPKSTDTCSAVLEWWRMGISEPSLVSDHCGRPEPTCGRWSPGQGQDTPGDATVPYDGGGVASREREVTDGPSRAGEESSLPPSPSVGITFVGSFY